MTNDARLEGMDNGAIEPRISFRERWLQMSAAHLFDRDLSDPPALRIPCLNAALT